MLLKLLLNQDKNGDVTLLAADADTDAAIDAAVDAVNEEADSPETFSLTDAQYDTLRQGIDDGAYAAAYSVSTLGSLRRLNSLLAKLTDLVETNDIAGFVDIYQQACDLYSGISAKLLLFRYVGNAHAASTSSRPPRAASVCTPSRPRTGSSRSTRSRATASAIRSTTACAPSP